MNSSIIGVLLAGSIVIGISVLLSVENVATVTVNEDATEYLRKTIRRQMESAYMEGQIDALTGDVRIVETDSTWEYIKTPWDDDKDLSTTQHLSQAK